MVVLATEARKVSVEDAILLNRAVQFRETAGGRLGTNGQSYRDILMTARKTCPLEACVPGARSNAEMRREDETIQIILECVSVLL